MCVGCKDVPGVCAFVEDVLVGIKHCDCAFVCAQIGPDGFHWVEVGCIGRQLQQGGVVGHQEPLCAVPPRAIYDQERVCAAGAPALAISSRCRFIAPASTEGRISPDAGERALLAHARFALEPYFQGLSLCPFRQDGRYDACKVFLNAACAAGSALGCAGRTDTLRKPGLAR